MASDPIGVLPAFLDRRRHALPGDLAWDGVEDFEQWADVLRRRWLAGLPPCADAAEAVVDGQDITLRFATGAESSGRFVLPDGPGPHPAVLLCHDHGGQFDIGWRKLADDLLSADSRARFYDGIALIDACRAAGFAVLCVDALGWGGRQTGGYGGQQALAANAMGLGWSLAGIVAAEDVQAARWLA
ncbi:hypothetical protein SAMN04488003_1288 [Loktanella fryxellensis]|uniref:Acetyl xylan esterase (AXE1) n=1 Tax=Loktanella fryxellensis TaxID=245187 RepID=A0A1H8IS21_9RHOB|nr:hypothetical protein [Loktanella fryxellensis]SEN71181.1 hypothetical protein SAMN04488003_1288 [Loktanella fryxellensis]